MIPYDSIAVNTYTLETHFILDPVYTCYLLVPYDRIAVNTYTLDTHSILDPGYTLLSPGAF